MQLPLGTTFHGTGEVGGSLERSGKRVSVFFSVLLFWCIYIKSRLDGVSRLCEYLEMYDLLFDTRRLSH